MSNNSEQKAYDSNGNISLKELVILVKGYMSYLFTYWYFIIFSACIFGAYFFFNAYSTPTTYTATISFMVNEDNSGGGAISGLLGQFGLGGSKSEYNLDKILALSRTNRILIPALFGENGKEFLVNSMIETYPNHFDNYWDQLSDNSWVNFRFKNSKVDSFNRLENTAVKRVLNKTLGNKSIDGLYSSGFDPDTGILDLSVESLNEELSFELVNNIYDHLSTYYIRQTLAPKKKAFKELEEQTDSVRLEIEESESMLIRSIDKEGSLLFYKDKFKQQKMAQKIQGLYKVYVQLLEQLKVAEFSLNTATPFFEVVDKPFYPLDTSSKSRFKAIIIGALLGGILSMFLLVMRKLIRDALN